MTAMFASIVRDATEAATKATAAYLAEGHHWFPCGFAWVTIRPATGKFVNYLRAEGIGRRDTHEGGWKIWNPSNCSTQSMEALMAGATAYAKVLAANGVRCDVGSRVD
jgi:hypothetical protein